MISFYPVISYRRVPKKKKATNYRIRLGHSLWSANQLPAQGVKFSGGISTKKKKKKKKISNKRRANVNFSTSEIFFFR